MAEKPMKLGMFRVPKTIDKLKKYPLSCLSSCLSCQSGRAHLIRLARALCRQCCIHHVWSQSSRLGCSKQDIPPSLRWQLCWFATITLIQKAELLMVMPTCIRSICHMSIASLIQDWGSQVVSKLCSGSYQWLSSI